MSSGRVIVRACWGGTCAMGGTDAAGAWSHRGSTLIEVRNGGGAHL